MGGSESKPADAPADVPPSWMSVGCCTNLSKASASGAYHNSNAPLTQRVGRLDGVPRPTPTMNTDDQSRLFALSESGEAAMLDVFLERQGPTFNVNVRNDEGETALHLAARNGKTQSCKILLRRGAELVPDAHGKTAYDLASSNGHTYCASLLRARMEGNLAVDAGSVSSRTSGPVSTSANNPPPAQHNSASHMMADATVTSFSTKSGLLQGSHLQSSKKDEEARHTGFTNDLPQFDGERENLTNSARTMPVRALYNYKASDEIPFPPDQRPEFSLSKGEQLEVVHMREDGWCIIRRGGDEGFAPGNYLTSNGKENLVKQYINEKSRHFARQDSANQ